METRLSRRDHILEQALALAPEDRAYVAEALESSLSLGDFATPEIAEAWLDEIERGALACERGEMASTDWRAVMPRLREQASSTPSAANP